MAETTIQPPPPKTASRPMPPRRPKRSLPARIIYAVQMRMRQMFAREALIGGLKSMPWVVFMTLLIWVYAEREQTAKQSITFRVEARNSDPDRLVELSIPSSDNLVHAELSGPQERLEQVRERLQSGALQIDVPLDLGPGKHPLDPTVVTNNELFVKKGLTVTGMTPAHIDVTIDEIDHRSIPVRIPPTITNLDGPAIFNPPRVTVSGPRSVLDAAAARGGLVANVKLQDLKEPGVKTIAGVPVELSINDRRVTISPATVSVTVNVKQNEVTGETSAPVWVAYPPGPKWKKYDVIPDTQTNSITVKVVGTQEAIDEVNKPDSENKLKAVLDVTGVGDPPDTNKTYEGPILYIVGKTGLKVAEGAPKTMPFKVVERTIPAGTN